MNRDHPTHMYLVTDSRDLSDDSFDSMFPTEEDAIEYVKKCRFDGVIWEVRLAAEVKQMWETRRPRHVYSGDEVGQFADLIACQECGHYVDIAK